MHLIRSILIPLLGCALYAADPEPAPTTARSKPPASSTAANDPAELEYEKLLLQDELAQEEADKWIREADEFAKKGAPISKATLAARVEQRFEPVRKAYEDFIQRHPKHTSARLAYGSFLNETGDSHEAIIQWEKARELDPSKPAAWNNLANHYGHEGPVKKAFEYYAKAIELDPKEPVYYHNLATTTYLFRKDAREYYQIEEGQVFDRALDLYRQAMKLDPTNLVLATDYAQSYYGIRPMRTNEALAAWKEALAITKNDLEREGIYIHLARVEIGTGFFNEARNHLNMVTNEAMLSMKSKLATNLVQKEFAATNKLKTPKP